MSRDNNPVLVATARHAGACQTGDLENIADAKRGITEAKLRRAVEEALVASPPLTDEVKSSIAHILMTSGAK